MEQKLFDTNVQWIKYKVLKEVIRRAYEGGLDEKGRAADTRTPAQRAALIALLRSLKVDYPNAEIVGHCELEGVHKDCPCFSCQEYRDYFKHLC